MSKERIDFRENLVRLDAAFPTKQMLKPTEVSAYLGIAKQTVLGHFTFRNGYISKVQLAREMCN